MKIDLVFLALPLFQPLPSAIEINQPSKNKCDVFADTAFIFNDIDKL
jgi:hypothetical protein